MTHDACDPTDWKQALSAWQAERKRDEAAGKPVLVGKIPVGWWQAAFADKPTPSMASGHRCGANQMLTIVAYDIREQRRLHRVAKLCEDYGVRVQYSVFECRLAADMFDRFWSELQALIDPREDRMVAYKICVQCSKNIQAAGAMVSNEQVVAYVF